MPGSGMQKGARKSHPIVARRHVSDRTRAESGLARRQHNEVRREMQTEHLVHLEAPILERRRNDGDGEAECSRCGSARACPLVARPQICLLLQGLLGLGLTCHLHRHGAIRERAVAEQTRKIVAPAVRDAASRNAAARGIIAGAHGGKSESAAYRGRSVSFDNRAIP